MVQDEERIPLISSSTTINSSSTNKHTLSWLHVSAETQNPSSSCRIPFSTHKQPTQRRLLSDLSGIAQPGQILAIMGTSGVGKTTLMNILSGQCVDSLLTVTGQVYLNGCSTTAIQRMTSGTIGYVEQNEIFIHTMTLQEHLIFQVMLRMRRIVSDSERRTRVKDIISQLHLNKCMSTTIGRLSGGEKKRLTLASVLLTEPHVLLIDEPTSGLDTYLAKSLMSMIRSMAVEQNHAVIVVLHQPTSSMFDLLDTLCLLVQDGRQAFFGTKEEAEKFFISKCHLSAPSLDGFIEQLAAPADRDNPHDIAQEIAAEQYAKSEEAHSLHATIERNSEGNGKNAEIPTDDVRGASFGRQLKWLFWRSFIADFRNPTRTVFILLRTLIPAIFYGLIYFDLRHSNDFAQNVDALIFSTISAIVGTSAVLIVGNMPINIHVCVKETSRGIYKVFPYYLAMVLHDFPTFISISFLFSTVIYWMSNMSNSWLEYFIFVTVLILVSNTAAALGEFISSFSSSIESAVSTMMITLQVLLIFSGFFLSLAHIPPVLRIAQYLSPFYYGYSTLFSIQWGINERNMTQQCYQRFLDDNGVLYPNITSSTIDCCARSVDINQDLTVLRGHTYFNIIMLIVLSIIWHIIAFTIIWYRAHRNRLNEYWLHTRKNKN